MTFRNHKNFFAFLIQAYEGSSIFDNPVLWIHVGVSLILLLNALGFGNNLFSKLSYFVGTKINYLSYHVNITV